MSKQFDYTKWLADLKAGDYVKCQGSKYEVGGVTEKSIIVLHGHSAVNFCNKTGRELGNRTGIYKELSIMPYTKEDESKEAAEEQKKKQRKELESLVDQIISKAIGPNGYCDRKYKMIDRYSKADLQKMLKLLNGMTLQTQE